MSGDGPLTPARNNDLRAIAAVIIPASAEFDVELRFRARAARGDPEQGLALIDKLDQAFASILKIGVVFDDEQGFSEEQVKSKTLQWPRIPSQKERKPSISGYR